MLRGLGLPDPGAVGGLRQALRGTSFYYSPQPLDGAGILAAPGRLGHWSAWGETAYTRFRGADGALNLAGAVDTATVGVDSGWGRWRAGMALSYSMGDGRYTHPAAAGGKVGSSLASLHPFVHYDINDGASVWAVLGYGRGQLTLTPDGRAHAIGTDLATTMAAFGGRGVFAAHSSRLGDFRFALAADARMTSTHSDAAQALAGATGRTRRVRLLLEGSGSMPLPGGAALRPTLEAGLRYDSGDAETGAGVELGAGLGYGGGRLSVQVNARGLLAHQDAGYREWGFSSSVRYAAAAGGRGLWLDLGSAWGATQSGVQSLWDSRDASALARSGAPDTAQRLNANLGYGLVDPRGGALWAPYVGAGAGGGEQALRLGVKLTSGPNLEAGLEFGRRMTPLKAPEHAIRFEGALRW